MTTNPVIIVVVTFGIIALSAFFVAVEFSLVAAKHHRLEDMALRSRSARAALRNSSELTLLLAGSQLGITVCTLALGAVTKPAVHEWLLPIFESQGWPEFASDATSFILALFIVTFLHLVIGEMAPKSWAIGHPEKSATMLAIPMRGFMWVTRPILRALNRSANWLVRRAGVEPSDSISTSQDARGLRQLVDHSVEVGALDSDYAEPLVAALQMQKATVASIATTDQLPTRVARSATIADVRTAARRSGHLRILLGEPHNISGVVHVRDTLTVPDEEPASLLARPVFILESATQLHDALAQMRDTRNHLAVVTEGERPIGIVTMADVLRRLLPEGLR